MTGFDIVLLSVGVLTLVWAVWSFICIQWTYRDRKQMIDDCVPGEDDFWEKLRRLESVSYNEHFRARFWLRDPHRLYD